MRLGFSAREHAWIALQGVLLFWPDLRAFVGGNASLVGLGLALLGTVSASLGNMAAARNQRSGLPVIPVIAWAMLYGSVGDAAWAALTHQSFTLSLTVPYLLSLLYLAVFGSVLAFAAYLTLMSRAGADRAGYALVSVPVAALALSSVLEGLRWTPLMWAGVALVLVGNVLVLRRWRPAAVLARAIVGIAP